MHTTSSLFILLQFYLQQPEHWRYLNVHWHINGVRKTQYILSWFLPSFPISALVPLALLTYRTWVSLPFYYHSLCPKPWPLCLWLFFMGKPKEGWVWFQKIHLQVWKNKSLDSSLFMEIEVAVVFTWKAKFMYLLINLFIDLIHIEHFTTPMFYISS